MICGIALAFVIIGCMDKYMGSKENVNQWIQEEEIEVADPNHWLEQGDGMEPDKSPDESSNWELRWIRR